MLPWALQQLCTRLPEMLRFAGGEALADALDPAEVAQSLREVETLARVAEAALRAQLRG
jgi:hypothetical protein